MLGLSTPTDSHFPQDGTTEVPIEESIQGWLVNLLGAWLKKNLDKATARWLQALREVTSVTTGSTF